MPMPKKDNLVERGGSGKMEPRTNGTRSSFRTDAAISSSRFGAERTLQPWIPDSNDGIDGSLEKSSGAAGWDQFAENERLFGITTNYDESIYTTPINKNHHLYRERMAAADKKAREIERSAPVTAHVAEERIMDYVGGKGDENEEDKYSGVRRQQEFPPLSSGRENRYTPPAKRAPTNHSTTKGVPVDPAIITAQLRGGAPKKQPTPNNEQARSPLPDTSRNNTPAPALPKPDAQRVVEAKKLQDNKPAEIKRPVPVQDLKAKEDKAVEKSTAPSRVTATPTTAAPVTTGAVSAAPAGPNRPSGTPIPEGTPSATSTVERDVLKEFKSFASIQRLNAEKVRSSKAKADKEIKLTELKNFATSFKLSTPVPSDLVSIIAKDPAKQKEIQAKAMKNAEEMAKAKTETKVKKETTAPPQPKPAEQTPVTGVPDARPTRPPAGPQATPPNNGPNRHGGPRQQFPQQYHAQGYRNNRVGPQHMPPQHQAGLVQRLRNNMSAQSHSSTPNHPHNNAPELRAPPTGPSNGVDASYGRRHSGHLGAKLNPNSNEFRPSPFAASFNPAAGPSNGSSPRTSVNHVTDTTGTYPQPTSTPLLRKKCKAVDVKKCMILAQIKTIQGPQGPQARNWDGNGGLRPPYDTLPTWRTIQDDEKADSTMHLTYKEYFERQPFAGSTMPTPNPPHVVPQIAHQHQLPFHLQHGAHNMVPRQSPHMPPMQMHNPQHGPVPHQPYGNDDHRMVHSNSAQSFASPRMGQLPVAYPGVNQGQVPYNQPVFVGPGNQMPYRSFSNNPQFVPPHGQMGGPMIMQPQFIPGPQGMVSGPHMMYPNGHHPQFMPPTGPPQPVPGANGYPSPGRPAAPMMAHQGSQQGHNMYGMSPNVQYNQPVYGPGQANGPSQ